jgi:hypothetical protein
MATVLRTGLIPHPHLYHHPPHDHKSDHSCSEYFTPISDSVVTQTPHIHHHRARGTRRLGVNPRNPAPCVCTRAGCQGRVILFSLEKLGWRCACIQFMCVVRLADFTLYPSIFFYSWGAFRETVDARLWTLGTAALSACYNPLRACALSFPFFPAFVPPPFPPPPI